MAELGVAERPGGQPLHGLTANRGWELWIRAAGSGSGVKSDAPDGAVDATGATLGRVLAAHPATCAAIARAASGDEVLENVIGRPPQ
jgi:hypothetical protein